MSLYEPLPSSKVQKIPGLHDLSRDSCLPLQYTSICILSAAWFQPLQAKVILAKKLDSVDKGFLTERDNGKKIILLVTRRGAAE